MIITKTSDKIKLYLANNKGKTKSWLSKELNISRPTLDNRLLLNCWEREEEIKLKMLGIV
uniref:Uncharacterized protein n=1 Tax=uncultured marine virus TaxID=186617 RepID=A0A0F7L7U8_9VIRU|nr:hypothetical protein [uncultured marine virus]